MIARSIIRVACLLIAVVLLAACAEKRAPGHGVYMLIDTSGTYTKELEKARQIINVILTRLYPGDAFAVARIDSGSFSEKDIIAKVIFDERPSLANQQKRQFKEQIDDFVKTVKPARYTDITGGILQGTEFLKEKKLGTNTIIIFSDMQEELDKRYKRDLAFELKDYNVIAVNVVKLKSDNFDPKKYLERLEVWETRIQEGGGNWKVTNDLDQLEKIFQ